MKPRHLFPALLCALLLGYPLSLGPVVMLFQRQHHNGDMPRWVEVLYYPLLYACWNSRSIDKAFDYYLRLWGVDV